ncbi:hypothetical protein Btru_029315 [Bulinus truncatus]|nr:hypothetical protein Btru_029315 [Bulinus truncatus]
MDQFNPCAKVTTQFARNLPRNLTYITASSNGLAIVEEVFDLLPRNLAYLDLSDNRRVHHHYNITVNAVQSSRRTLIVLSDHLLKSTWCKFELQMANIESVHTGRPVIIFLFIQQLLEETMGRELLHHIQNNTYIQLPNNQATEESWNYSGQNYVQIYVDREVYMSSSNQRNQPKVYFENLYLHNAASNG